MHFLEILSEEKVHFLLTIYFFLVYCFCRKGDFMERKFEKSYLLGKIMV